MTGDQFGLFFGGIQFAILVAGIWGWATEKRRLNSAVYKRLTELQLFFKSSDPHTREMGAFLAERLANEIEWGQI